MQEVILHTNGNGLWTDVERAVRIVDMVLDVGTQWEGEDDIFGEFRVYFNKEDWDTAEDGLIYTDKGFLRELREFLDAHGLPGDDVCYSEQGMQGDDYVSLDAGTAFYTAWMAKFGVAEDSPTMWEVSFDYGPHMSKTVKVKAGSKQEAKAKVEKAAEKSYTRGIMINWVKPAKQGVAKEQLVEQF